MPRDDHTLAITLAGIPLRNPVLLAAGTAGTLDEYAGVLPLDRLGGIVTKSLTPEPREGNNTWRIIESRAGMLNAIGLTNPGVDRFDANLAARAATLPTTIFASAAGFSIPDYERVVSTLDPWADPSKPDGGGGGIPAIEVNISCPNVKTGTEFGHSPALTRDLLTAVRPLAQHARLFVKLSPVTPDLVAVARAAIDAGADGLTISNTIPAMAIDVETRRPRLANVTGGLSGPALHPVSVRLVHEVYRKLARDRGIPIIGAGGVMTWADAAEFILAGATAVQMGTALFADPRSPLKVIDGLARWARRQRVSSISELVGALAE
ncbi:MAG: dihydroorotate dehydrogenase [Phycisphaeraceae bacterium]|nr:dihydroorotate dehydrogenase [Phycisphaeraceae bacterium]